MTSVYDSKVRDIDWEQDQLSRSELSEDSKKFVNGLLDAYWSAASKNGLSREDEYNALDAFKSLSQGYALVEPEPEAVWVQAKPGNLVVRDYVRVRRDAYPRPFGLVHNSREGVITAIRNGVIFVKYTDGVEPSFEFTQHRPGDLEKKIR